MILENFQQLGLTTGQSKWIEYGAVGDVNISDWSVGKYIIDLLTLLQTRHLSSPLALTCSQVVVLDHLLGRRLSLALRSSSSITC